MFGKLLTVADKALVSEIDKSVKNKWTFNWLDESVKATITKTVGKQKVQVEVSTQVRQSIHKIDKAGQALLF